MNVINIKSKVRDFKVNFVNNFDFVQELLKVPYYDIVVGSNVYNLYKEAIFNKFPKERLIILELEEEKKTLETVIRIYKKLLKRVAKKNLTLISFGGGLNQDITGFVASTLYRGINWIFVPTTLLAMSDSSIGLKTSLNFKSYKNILGTFFPPNEIFINVDFLKTLPKKDYYSGIGEVIKLFLMKDNSVNELKKIENKTKQLKLNRDSKVILNIIKESIKIKLSYMEGDEFDRGRRNLLNYGHELGHALESASGFDIPHGVAVLIGIVFANYVSLKRKWLERSIFDYINNKLILPNIMDSRVELKKEYFNEDILLENIKKDKKRVSEKLVLILPKNNLKLCKIQDLEFWEFKEGIKGLKNVLKI